MIIAQADISADGRNYQFAVYRPEQDESDPLTWTCRYKISSDEVHIDHRIYGVSSLQALALALNIVAVRAEILGVFVGFGSMRDLGTVHHR